jgi:hypothetical protein
MAVATDRVVSPAAGAVERLRRAPELAAERGPLGRLLAAAPDKVLALVAQMEDPAALPADAGPVTYARARTPTCNLRLCGPTLQISTGRTSPRHNG